MNFADIIIDIFALESTVVRAGQHSFDDAEKQKSHRRYRQNISP